jgi:hypothetical protein
MGASGSNAAQRYQNEIRPAIGSTLSFRGTGRMAYRAGDLSPVVEGLPLLSPFAKGSGAAQIGYSPPSASFQIPSVADPFNRRP